MILTWTKIKHKQPKTILLALTNAKERLEFVLFISDLFLLLYRYLLN
jgi:hypothetical protein